MTPDICGRGFEPPFASYDPDSCSWKTWRAISLWDSMPSSVTLPRTGSMRNGRLFERPMSVPATAERACSTRQHIPRARRGNADLKDAGETQAQQKEQGRQKHDECRRLELEAPSQLRAARLKSQERARQHPERLTDVGIG